ncbi:MAG: hypothetical protein IJ733_10805, partial [Lachnospiraceae bacterium]|nr:hypothetical protein [Lachnospiraceae bacterium]
MEHLIRQIYKKMLRGQEPNYFLEVRKIKMRRMMRQAICTLMTGALAGALVLGCGKTEEKTPEEAGSRYESSQEVGSSETSDGEVYETSGEKDENAGESSEESNDSSLMNEAAEGEKGTSENTEDEKAESETAASEKKENEKASNENTKKEKNEDAASGDGLDLDNGKTLDKIFENCAAIGEGVAGVSLKRTEQAYEVASYAAKNAFTEDSLEALKSAFSKRYQALDPEEKESFTEAFDGGIISLLDQAILKGDFSSIRGQFDDVGKAEGMEKLLKKKGLKESWRTVKKAYQKMEKENK